MTRNITRDEYIKYRFDRAWKTYEDAKYLAAGNCWNSSMNRLYYACFYAILALFSKYSISSHKHAGTKTQFSLHFIKTGLLHKEFGKLYGDLFDLRQKGDYLDFIELEEKNVVPFIPKVEKFLKQVELMVKNGTRTLD